MKTRLLSIFFATGMLCLGTAHAQAGNQRVYVSDARNEVATSGAGLCWRTGYWTPAAAANDAAGCACDKDLMPADKCQPALAKAAPAAPAAAPAAPPAPRKCDFAAALQDDRLFEFNKAKLKPSAMAQLDKDVIGKLSSCAQVSMVIVTGHTDRLGSQLYNQKLSEKRADVVRDYLVKKGVSKDLIDTMGAGKTQPASGVSCDDRLPRNKLIQCLAPNRRTVVEVRGLAK